MVQQARAFAVQLGEWNGHGNIPDGYSDGYYYVRGKIGLNGVHEWKGPFDTLATAQPYAVRMIEEWGFNFAKKFRSGLWRVEIGKRSWQSVPHRWYLYPEDSTDAATYREGVRSGSGKTVATYVKPTLVSYDDDTYHGYFPEDYNPDFFPAPPSSVTIAALGCGVWAEVYRSPTVIVNAPELFVPDAVYPTQTELYGPMSGFEYAILNYGKVPETILDNDFLNAASASAAIAVASDNSVIPPGITLVGAEVQYKSVNRYARQVWFNHNASGENIATQVHPPFMQEFQDSWQYGSAPNAYITEAIPGIINSGPVAYSNSSETNNPLASANRLISTDSWDVVNLPEFILPGFNALAFVNEVGPEPDTSTGLQWRQVDNSFKRIVVTVSTRLVYERAATGERIYSEFVDTVFRVCSNVNVPFPYTFIETGHRNANDLTPYITGFFNGGTLHTDKIPAIGNDGIWSADSNMSLFYNFSNLPSGTVVYNETQTGTGVGDIPGNTVLGVYWDASNSNFTRAIDLPPDIKSLVVFLTQTADSVDSSGNFPFCCRTFESGNGTLKLAGIQPYRSSTTVAVKWNKGDATGAHYPNGATYLNFPECFAYFDVNAQAQGVPSVSGNYCNSSIDLALGFITETVKEKANRADFSACGVNPITYTFGQSYEGVAAGTARLWVKGPNTAVGNAVAVDTSSGTGFALSDGTEAYYNLGIQQGPTIPGYGIFGYGELPVTGSSGPVYISPLYVPGPALFFINADSSFQEPNAVSATGIGIKADPLPLDLSVIYENDNQPIGYVNPNPLSSDMRTYGVYRKPPKVMKTVS